MKKKEQNDDELLFWSLLFIWGTSGEVLESASSIYRRKDQSILALLFYDRLARGISKCRGCSMTH